MPNSKQIVYLSQVQYAELIANGTITVNGVTVTYDENDIYVTPQAEPVTDVRINGTSIAANGVAEIPVGGYNQYGIFKLTSNNATGIQIDNGALTIAKANTSEIKNGGNGYKPITPVYTDAAAFYGLAKAAGHNENSSTEPVGTYTPEAKGAIQSMLGVSDLIATAENSLVASRAYAIGDVFTANGKLYKATAAIAADAAIITDGANANCEETSVGDGFPHDVQVNGVSVVSNGIANVPIATVGGSYGAVKLVTGLGVGITGAGNLYILTATANAIKAGVNTYNPITPSNQDASSFYGLAKAAGDTTQSQSDNAVGTYTDEAKAAIKSMIGVNVEDVQINGTSVVSSGVANIPVASSGKLGVVQLGTDNSLSINAAGQIYVTDATSAQCKAGASRARSVTPYIQHASTFYGLAKAAGDTTQSESSNAIGTYTDNAKASIKSMLGIVDGSTGTVDVTGTTPTIVAVENTRYVCGEVTSLDFTPAASGICIVRFTSGSTVTVLTLPSTVKFPEWFDATTLETNTIYEICITDGIYGAVMSWAL